MIDNSREWITGLKMVKELINIEMERDNMQQKWGFTVQVEKIKNKRLWQKNPWNQKRQHLGFTFQSGRKYKTESNK